MSNHKVMPMQPSQVHSSLELLRKQVAFELNYSKRKVLHSHLEFKVKFQTTV